MDLNLVTPDGREYKAHSKKEATQLIRTRGYRPAEKKQADKPAPKSTK